METQLNSTEKVKYVLSEIYYSCQIYGFLVSYNYFTTVSTDMLRYQFCHHNHIILSYFDHSFTEIVNLSKDKSIYKLRRRLKVNIGSRASQYKTSVDYHYLLTCMER